MFTQFKSNSPRYYSAVKEILVDTTEELEEVDVPNVDETTLTQLEDLINEICRSKLIPIDGKETAYKKFEFGSKKCAISLCHLLFDKLIYSRQQATTQEVQSYLGIFANRLLEIIKFTHPKEYIQEYQDNMALYNAYESQAMEIIQDSQERDRDVVEMTNTLVDHFTATQIAAQNIRETRKIELPRIFKFEEDTTISVENVTRKVDKLASDHQQTLQKINHDDQQFKAINRGPLAEALQRIK